MEANPTVFDPVEHAAVRAKALAEQEEQLLTFARTASTPLERVVQAELAEEVRQTRIRWQDKGLIALPEGAGRKAALVA